MPKFYKATPIKPEAPVVRLIEANTKQQALAHAGKTFYKIELANQRDLFDLGRANVDVEKAESSDGE